MKRILCLGVLLVAVWCLSAVNRLTFNQLQSGGWEHMIGQTVCITTPLVVCGTFADSVLLAPERLYVPEERAAGLADGDSADYWRREAYNRSMRICLQCPKSFDLNLGAVVHNLKAKVTGVRRLQTGRMPRFRNFWPSKRLPSLNNPDLVLCAANIQNYFVHLGGYASANTTPGQHALQAHKVASALVALKADLYALCELEKGETAPAELTAEMNSLMHGDCFDFVRTEVPDGDTISVGFIYNRNRVHPYGRLCFAYPDRNSIYACRFLLQGFEDCRTGERFVLSLNHLRSKRGKSQESLAKRMANVSVLLRGIRSAYADSLYTDPDVLLVGDFNAYAMERPLQTLVREGYEDLLPRFDSLAYTYSYHGECGALDRVYASPSMAAQVTAVCPVHWNTDFYWSAAYWSKYNFKNRLIPQERPVDLRRVLSRAARRNLLFRYSDHDPLLIGIRFSPR